MLVPLCYTNIKRNLSLKQFCTPFYSTDLNVRRFSSLVSQHPRIPAQFESVVYPACKSFFAESPSSTSTFPQSSQSCSQPWIILTDFNRLSVSKLGQSFINNLSSSGPVTKKRREKSKVTGESPFEDVLKKPLTHFLLWVTILRLVGDHPWWVTLLGMEVESEYSVLEDS